MSFKPAALLPVALMPALAACASASANYPSLAVRDVERASGTFAPPESAPPRTAPAPEVLDRIDGLAAEADRAHQAFMAALPATRRTVTSASGGEVGSENWAQAQVALAGLEAERGKAMIALADIDRLYVDAGVAGDEVTRIATVHDRVSAQVAEQDAAVGNLLASLP